jgi:hypothetical protein
MTVERRHATPNAIRHWTSGLLVVDPGGRNAALAGRRIQARTVAIVSPLLCYCQRRPEYEVPRMSNLKQRLHQLVDELVDERVSEAVAYLSHLNTNIAMPHDNASAQPADYTTLPTVPDEPSSQHHHWTLPRLQHSKG